MIKWGAPEARRERKGAQDKVKRRVLGISTLWLVLALLACVASAAQAEGAVLPRGLSSRGELTRPAGVGTHWAWSPARALVKAGIGGPELEKAVASPSGKGLDDPLSPLEWNGMVAQALGEEPGRGERGDRRYWLYVYTAGEDGGNRCVVSRGFAAAGLFKIGNMYGLFPGSSGPLQYVTRFPDWKWLDEKGYAGPCDHMAAAGLLSGYPDGTLRPEAPLTRGEAAALLKGWLELKAKMNR